MAGAGTSEQAGPIVVYGASGYTGKLICAELAQRGADFVIAGRSRDRLEAVAAELGGERTVAAVALDDGPALRGLVGGAAAVIGCAGPFTLHGEPLIAAAASRRSRLRPARTKSAPRRASSAQISLPVYPLAP